MIIGEKFPHDRHQWVMEMQHDCYDVGSIFKHARDHYRQAEAILEIQTEIGKRLWKISAVDHRTLQDTHDLIAAHFRKINDLHLDPQLFTTLSEQDKQVKNDWLAFYQEEIRCLCLQPEFVSNVCKAVVFPNPHEVGIEAEKMLSSFLGEHYGL